MARGGAFGRTFRQRRDSMNENGEDPGLKGRNPLNGLAILGGLLLIAFGLADAGAFLIAGSVLFAGGLI